MGYSTRFELQVLQEGVDLDEVVNKLAAVMGFSRDETNFAIDDEEDGPLIRTDFPIKWYDHDEDCVEMSKSFPGVLFKLHGEGEQNGDMWDAYYRDGLCQICRGTVVYPPFDPAKLKPVDEAQKEDSGRP